MLNTTLPPWPSYSKEEADIAASVLLSNKVNTWTGNETKLFEDEFSNYIGVNHAIAVANGTLALELCLIANDIGVGDEVIVTPRTFLASVSCIIRVGAVPVFADVDLISGNISASTILPVLSYRTKAILCVHLGGIPCDMDDIMSLAVSNSLTVIEDCAQAHGAEYKGKKLGAIGHCAAFSFCQDKIMTTAGEGGMFTTNDLSIWHKAWAYKDHGKNPDTVYRKDHPKGFRWLHESFGSNYRITEIQAAIGRYQLKKLDDWLTIRARHADKLSRVARRYPFLRVFSESLEDKVAVYRFYMFIKIDELPKLWNREKIIDAINEAGIPCFSGTCCEVYLEKAFDGTTFVPEKRLINAKLLGESSLCFLVHSTIPDEQMDRVCSELHAVFLRISEESLC